MTTELKEPTIIKKKSLEQCICFDEFMLRQLHDTVYQYGSLHFAVPMSAKEYAAFYPGMPIPYDENQPTAFTVHEIPTVLHPEIGIIFILIKDEERVPTQTMTMQNLFLTRQHEHALEWEEKFRKILLAQSFWQDKPIPIRFISFVPDVIPTEAPGAPLPPDLRVISNLELTRLHHWITTALENIHPHQTLPPAPDLHRLLNDLHENPTLTGFIDQESLLETYELEYWDAREEIDE